MAASGERVWFVHVPRTGGTFVTYSLEVLGIAQSLDGDAHRVPELDEIGGRVVIGSARHPASWLASYWQFRQRGGRACCGTIDELIVPGEKWLSFATRVAQRSPGAVSRAWRCYLALQPDERFWARQERLGGSLLSVLAAVGCDVPAVDMPTQQARQTATEWPAGVLERLLAANDDLYRRFSYGAEPPSSRSSS